MSSREPSKQDIAKQFDLPERKSKIATLLKEADVYCICRSSDSTRFMIACDYCEEWYHGDCMNITEPDSRHIKSYFCPPCMEKNPSLEIEYKKPKLSSLQKQTEIESKKTKPSPLLKQKTKSSSSPDKKYKHDSGKKAGKPKKSSDVYYPKATATRSSRPPKGYYYSDSDSEEDKQCFGPDCINSARQNSKYCCDDCCSKLATERIYRILPGRIQEWNLTPSVAEDRNRKELEEGRQKQVDAKKRIAELEKKREDLDRHVKMVQLLTADPDMEDDEPEEEGTMHCITCGVEISVKICLKHMERCYNKYESQTSFGSIYKTKLEGTPIFCDFFNILNGTYCKRLAVLCPEHSKEPKISDTEVCGSPRIKNLTESTGDFCRLPKKKCSKHYCWEKLRRAELDMERVRNWMKLDELLEQERQIRTAMTNRGSLMGLLLHSTFDHDLRNRIQSQQQQQQQQQQKPKSPVETITSPTDMEIISDFSEEEEDFVRAPLVKSREHQKEKRKSIESKPEMTASKLFKSQSQNNI